MIIQRENEFVDLEAPIDLTEEQREELVEFLEGYGVEVKEVKELSKKMNEKEGSTRTWTVDERLLLFTDMTIEEIAKKIDRSDVSVGMQQEQFCYDYEEYAHKKGKTGIPTAEEIEEYLAQRKTQ